MSIRKLMILVVVWVASLVAVGTLVSAQQQSPTIISGNDIGFRLDPLQRSNRITGTLVVRVNGQWVEAQFAAKTGPASQ